MRSGVIAKKVGMTRIFTEDGMQVPVTVLHMDNVQVVSTRTNPKDGYTAVQLGAGSAKVKNVSKAARGHFSIAKVEPKQKMAEFRVSEENLIEIRVTTQNLKIVKTDLDRGLIMVKGAVPGSKGGWVTIKDATKKPTFDGTPFPASLRSQQKTKPNTEKVVIASNDDESGGDAE